LLSGRTVSVERSRTSVDVPWRSLLRVVALVGAIALLVVLWKVALIVVVAFMLVGALDPLVERVNRWGLSRSAAIGVVFAALVVVSAAIALLTIPPLVSDAAKIVQDLPRYQERAVEILGEHRLTQPLAAGLRNPASGDKLEKAIGYLISLSPALAEVVALIVSVVVLALYFLVDRDRIRGAAFSLVPRAHHLRFARILERLEVIVGGYVRGQVITSGIAGAFTFALLLVLKVPNALPLAAFAALMDALPYVGAVLAVTPAALSAAGRGIGVLIALLAGFFAYQELESRFIIPRIYGRVLRLPSSVVLLALLAGGSLLGVVGALLALPVAAGLVMLIEELPFDLPGDAPVDPALQARERREVEAYLARTEGLSARDAAPFAMQRARELLAREPEVDPE
jgi:predicted PurR-regulated permease PerM